MKSGKFLFLAIIFLVSLVCISAVSAADEAVSDVIADTNDETVLQESIDDATLADSPNDELILEEINEPALDSVDEETTPGTFTDLHSDINGNSDPVVTLTRNYTFTSEDSQYSQGIDINRSVTIDGQGHTINVNEQSRIFNVKANNVIIKNITFANGKVTANGAAINVNAYYDYVNITGCTFINNTAWWGGAVYFDWYESNRFVDNCTFINNHADKGGAVCSQMWGVGNINNCIYKTDSDTTYNTIDIAPTLTVNNLTTAYNSGEKLTFNLTTDSGMLITDGNIFINVYKNDDLIGTYNCLSGDGWVVDLPIGIYNATFKSEYIGGDQVTATITVTKKPVKIAASAVTATYNVNKYLVIKLTDDKGSALNGVKVTVSLGTAKTYTTDKNGQIKINVANLVPKTYTAKIAYAGNAYYAAASKSAKVVVKKATPKLTAKAKTFKVKVKTKKYTVTLKNNKGKVLKKVKLTLKVGKKTYKATTNSKGKATFKITKLTKKGKYTATIKFAGSKYYKKLTKKVKITVKK